MFRKVMQPGPKHPITVEPTAGRVLVRAGGRTVADSTNALTLRESTYPPVQYIPLGDIDRALLRRTDSKTYCPFKGDAGYYSVVTPDAEITDAGWTYEQPYPAVQDIAGYVAFYPNKVEISVEN